MQPTAIDLPSAYDPTIAETTWYRRWEEAGYFAPTDAGSPYCIVIPPPNVTGSLHMGHALTLTIEDMLVRWRRMQGRAVLWLPGTDHAGIATQMVVERELQKSENKTRHDLGRDAFLERVWRWKEELGSRITKQQRVLGCSVDWSRERFTLDEGLSAAVREVFVRLFRDGLIYRARRLVNWCPRCHTALSDLEVEHDEEHQSELWSFAYPLANGAGEIVVATTRPETMLGDTAVAVHPDDPRYTHCIGQRVRHPILGYLLPIIADATLVDPTFGTGAVKVTPAHDFNDFQTGLRHSLAHITLFDADARVRAEPLAPADILKGIDRAAWQRFAGLEREKARDAVKRELDALGLARGSQPHKLALAQCQRCRAVLEPTLSVQWFVRTEPLAKPALEAVQSGHTRIVPETWTKTYYHWMENIQDWCISRQLWWGHRIPAWFCMDCDGAGLDRALRDDAQPIVAKEAPGQCPRCGGSKLVQDQDVLDTWFSSALWPFSTLGWPKETDDLRRFYPNSVMETGSDILFFWVARMMMMGCHLLGRPPFPVIYLHAMVRDRHGDKMSKTKGNVIDPLQLVHGCSSEEVSPQFRAEFPKGFPAFGADALRFTLAAMSASGRDIKLSVERIAGYRAFANKLWNASRFALMRVGKARPLDALGDGLAAQDRFILSRLSGCVRAVDSAMEGFRFADAADAVYHFLWDELCDWYIELVKPRLDAAGSPEAKVDAEAASATLLHCLDTTMRLLHPMMPFITEEIWQRLPLPKDAPSIMVSRFPEVSTRWENPEVEQRYARVQELVTAVRTIRAESHVPPSKRIAATVVVTTPLAEHILRDHRDEVMHLARLSELLVTKDREGTLGECSVQVLSFCEVRVPLAGLIDVAEERQRLQKAIAKAEKERAQLLGKLANEKFLQNAPAEVVEKDRQRALELESMLTKLSESQARL